MTEVERRKKQNEMANKWFSEYKPAEMGFLNGRKCYSEKMVKEAYIEGTKENGLQWHKVADGDLPDNTNSVLSDKGVIVYYNFTHDCWVDERASVEIDDVIAWCEIPPFTED